MVTYLGGVEQGVDILVYGCHLQSINVNSAQGTLSLFKVVVLASVCPHDCVCIYDHVQSIPRCIFIITL